MAINTIEHAHKYTDALDKMLVQKSATGFLADNALRAQFVGAATVLIPNVEFAGLTKYDRDTGFSVGATTVDRSSHTLTMDRGRSLQIDAQDMDETGIAELSGQVMGEFVRTQVVPEMDAYVISALAKIASENGGEVDWADATPYKVFADMKAKVRDEAGFDEELVCFIDPIALAALENSAEIQRMITVSDFKQGEINRKVKSIDGIALIPVSSNRMKNDFTFATDATGGFAPADGAASVRMLMLPKKGASLIKKTETIRIWDPSQNINADAYKFDYRAYYDVLVKKSHLKTICVSEVTG